MTLFSGINSFSFEPPDFGLPKLLPRQLEVIQSIFDVQPKEPNRGDLGALLAKLWKVPLDDWKQREVRQLPWLLNYGPRPHLIEQAENFSKVLSFLESNFKNSYLKYLIHIYLKHYHPQIPGFDLLRRFIHKHLISYNGKSPRLNRWKGFDILLFSPNGHRTTASKFEQLKADDVIAYIESLGFTGDLASCRFLKETIRTFLEKTVTQEVFYNKVQKTIALLEVNEQNVSRLRFTELDTVAASELIPKAGINAPDQIQDSLRSFFLRHLHDPRLPGGAPKWRKVDPTARKIFGQWIAKKDLEFFFNVVDKTAKDPHWQYRRKFWEACLPHIESTWVILGNSARRLVFQSSRDMQAHFKERRFGNLIGGSSEQSVFLIEMKGHVFVEWSNAGACRVFNKRTVPVTLGLKQYRTDDLRFAGYVARQLHHGAIRYKWQLELSVWIIKNLGIHIKQSEYRLYG